MARKKREVKDRETREREIQAAAKEVFYRTGYQAASIEAIAKKANIAKGTIYLYYQNKGDLYVSLMIQGTQRINDNLTVLEDRLIRNAMTSGREIIMELLECFHQVYRPTLTTCGSWPCSNWETYLRKSLRTRSRN